MRPVPALVSFALSWALVSGPALAQEPAPAADDFNMLFATTCMKHFHTPDTLREAMVKNGVEELIGEQSRFFLDGAPGKAWILDGSSGKYVVSLREDAICAVFAQQAKPDVVRAGFEALVKAAPAPLVSRRVEDPAMHDHADTVTYAWSRPEDDVDLVFMLTTSTDPDVSAQAMASMALAKKED